MARKKAQKKIKKVKKKPKEEKQARGFIFFMIALLLIVLVISFWASISRKFDYAGVEFNKVKQGDLNLYYAKFPLRDVSGQITAYLPFYFREDPRELNRIEINGTIKLKTGVALAVNSDNIVCEDSVLSGATLSLFLNSVGVSPFGATTNKTEAEEFNRIYVSCENPGNVTVLLYKGGDTSKIEQKGDCYVLNIANCEIMNVTERFMIGLYAHSRGIEI